MEPLEKVNFAASKNAGGDTSNTPPATRHDTPKFTENLGHGGEDWFEASVYLNWHPGKARMVFERLAEMKEEARLASKASHGFGALPGSAGQWKVHPVGCRMGEAGKGPVMLWKFERDGIVFGLTDRVAAHATHPSGFVRMTGEAIIALGSAESMWNTVLRWFDELGAQVEKALVSRVDVCWDMAGMSVQPFVDAVRAARVVRRTRNRDDDTLLRVHGKGKRDTGLTLGRGTLLRIYDKAVECQDLAKRAWLIHRRWDGKDQKTATRVEFQLRREFLTAKKCRTGDDGKLSRPAISTVQDYFDRRSELVRYLVLQWVRFVAVGHDERQTKRSRLLPEWELVIRGFEAWVGGRESVPLDPLPRHLAKPRDMAKQARGCFEAAAAREGKDFHTADELVEYAFNLLWPEIEHDNEIGLRIARRRSTLATVAPEPPIDYSVAPF